MPENLSDQAIGELASLARSSGMTAKQYSKELVLGVASLGIKSITSDEGITHYVLQQHPEDTYNVSVIVAKTTILGENTDRDEYTTEVIKSVGNILVNI